MRRTAVPIALALFAALHALVAGGANWADTQPRPTFEELLVPMREPGVFGGRFVIASANDARTFNPILASETNSVDVTDRLFTALAEFNNSTQKYAPALASRWEASADGLEWVWHLRRGARFSDGHPITSADVVFSFNVANDTTLHSPAHDALLVHGEPIQVTARGPHTVVTRISRGYALMVPTVASLRILPRHVLEPVWRAGRFATSYSVTTRPESLVTSGAWTLREFVPHEKTVLARNPRWYGVDTFGRRLPYLDQLIFLIVRDQNTAALKFQSNDGELDALDNVKAEDYAEYAKNQAKGDYTLYDLGPTLTSNFFWFNLNTAKTPASGRQVGQPYLEEAPYSWFSDRDFRRAVSMAIDRDAMIRSVFFGDGVKSWSVITPGNRVFYNRKAPAFDYSPDEAKQLLASIGFEDRNHDGVIEDAKRNPVRFTLKTNSNSNTRVQLANFVRDDLARVGIQCTLVPVEFNTMIGNIQNDFGYEAALGGLGSTIPPDPGLGANFYLSSGSTHFWNARQRRPETPAEASLDSLFDAIVSTVDPEARKRISAQMEDIIGEQAWVIWLPVLKLKVPVRNRFGNVEPSTMRHRILWNIETVFVKSAAAKPKQ